MTDTVSTEKLYEAINDLRREMQSGFNTLSAQVEDVRKGAVSKEVLQQLVTRIEANEKLLCEVDADCDKNALTIADHAARLSQLELVGRFITAAVITALVAALLSLIIK